MKYSIEGKNITKKIGNNLIIDDVSFKLEKGKIYGLVGANGSGKSTLLKIILGLYNKDGEIIINGMDIRKNFNSCLSIMGGIVDYVSFYEFLSAYENVRYFALLYDVPLNRAKEVLEIVKLNPKDPKLVKKFSLGMKQRLGIAISLLKDPDILILDEPTNGLDPKGIIELRDLLTSFKEKTIIISSHIISEIEKVSNEIIFVHNNKIYQKSLVDINEKHMIKITTKEDYKVSIPSLAINEKGEGYLTDEEVSKAVTHLVKEGLPIYRVEKEDSLENLLISMMEDEKND